MERSIKLSELKAALSAAYDKFKSQTLEGAAPSPKTAGMNEGRFGISLRLADGTKFDVGDTQATFAMGSILRVPVYTQLLTQAPVEEIVRKLRYDKMPCGCNPCKCGTEAQAEKPAKTKAKHGKSLRMISLVQPEGDPEGKMEIITNLMASMMGSPALFDDKLYQANVKRAQEANLENSLAEADFELYDSAPVSIEIYNKLAAMLVTTEQLAEMGATIAADGVNPTTKTPVFDGTLSAPILAMMAAQGPKHVKKSWNMITGTPMMCGFGGGVMAVIPGFGSISAFSPELIAGKVPARAAMAIKEVLQKFGLNAFASARVEA